MKSRFHLAVPIVRHDKKWLPEKHLLGFPLLYRMLVEVLPAIPLVPVKAFDKSSNRSFLYMIIIYKNVQTRDWLLRQEIRDLS